MNIKKYIENYYNAHFTQMEIPLQLKNQLKRQLFMKVSTPKKTAWKLPLFFSATGGIAIMAAFLAMQNSTIKSNISIPAALAASIENSFGNETITKTFGLGDTTTFKHRIIKVQSNTETQDSVALQYDLYGFNNDTAVTVSSLDGNTMLKTILSQSNDKYCFTTETETLECKSLTAFKEQATTGIMSEFSEKIDSTWIKNIEGEEFESEHNGSSAAISFTTNKELLSGSVSVFSYSFPNNLSGGDIINYKDKENDDEEIYLNRPTDAGFKHGRPFDFRSSDATTLYVQFKNGDIYSDIYKYDRVTSSIHAIAYEDMKAEVTSEVLQTEYTNIIEPYVFEPLRYLQKNPDISKNATVIEEHVDKNGIISQHVQLQVDESMYFQIHSPLSTRPVLMDIWYDIENPKIIAYSLLDENEEPIVEIEITDTYPMDDPSTIFNQ